MNDTPAPNTKKPDNQKLEIGDDLPDFILPMMEASRQFIQNEHNLFARLKTFRPTRIMRGQADFSITVPADFSEGASASGERVIHGGIFTILLDTILAYTVWTRLDQFMPIATINLKTDYLGHAEPEQAIKVMAHCEGIADDVAFCSGKAVCAETGDVIALAEGTFMVGTKGRSSASRL
ncbi:PaaI family thioesterase [Parvularcula flava]|uniref:PaaI family thioesterase n=1 Tax=Aquisalinus luteolus TaxID=1566827 RepID=A0A8J3A181_9PROT|nr:PaaI family thioesterase [Aquisalinus luteolus]NHK27423.1 PaaI family thioesterase [Aquisalinus luteolus]GGH95396.1 hypothetical protein GCM10011355_11830 [Aquisalinus luteolus]